MTSSLDPDLDVLLKEREDREDVLEKRELNPDDYAHTPECHCADCLAYDASSQL